MTEALLTSGLFGIKYAGKFWNLFFLLFQLLARSSVGLAPVTVSQRSPMMHVAERWGTPFEVVEYYVVGAWVKQRQEG